MNNSHSNDDVWIPLSNGGETVVSRADYDRLDLGRTTWRRFTPSKRNQTSYVQGFRDGRPVYLHRLLLGLTPGDGRLADHVSTDGLDNRSSNLRVATPAQNAGNAGPRRTNRSGFKGVLWHAGGRAWLARIRPRGCRSASLGLYRDVHEAAHAVNAAATQLHGEFAWHNPIPPEHVPSADRRARIEALVAESLAACLEGRPRSRRNTGMIAATA